MTGVGAGSVNVTETDRVDNVCQDSKLVCIAKAVVAASASGSLIIGDGISVLIGAGMTPGTIGEILGEPIDIEDGANICVQFDGGAIAMSADFRRR